MSLVTHDQITDCTVTPHVEPPPLPAAQLPWEARLSAHKARLAELDAELQTNVTELQVRIHDARNAQMAARASAEAEYAADVARLEAELSHTAIAYFAPAFRAYYAQPTRAALREMAAKWVAFRADVEAELGSPASHLVLTIVAVAAFGERLPQTWRTHGAGGASSSYVGDVAAALAKALERADMAAADSALDRLCQLTQTQPTAFDARIEDYQRCVTQGAFSRARDHLATA